MKQIHKEYEQSFLLEPTKLTRLIDTIHERLGDHPRTTTHDHFEVFLSGNRREELTSIDAVLALENSHKQKIQRLLITSSARAEGALPADHEIQVDFAGNKTNPTSNKNAKVVAVSVRSNQAGWASRTLSEVEEQVERTWQRNLQSILALAALIACALFVLVALFVSFSGGNLAFRQSLNDSDLDRLEQILNLNRTMTDEEEREITTRQYRNILEDRRPKQSPQKGGRRRLVFIGVPFLVLLVCGFTLLLTCYPRAVFLWGDESERYANVLHRRKVLWGVIIAVTITGVASNLFIRGVDSWLPP
jgi:hypothetical protein